MSSHDTLTTVGNAVKKYVLSKKPDARVEILSSENWIGKDDMGTSATSSLSTFKVTANVNDNVETHYLFRKDMYEASEGVKEFVKNAQVYQKEVGIYTQWLPFLEDFQKQKKVKPLTLAVPEYYDSEVNEDTSYLILDNVGVDGFRITKELFLTYDEVVVAIKELAKLHAIGHAIVDVHKDNILQTFPFLKNMMTQEEFEQKGASMFVECLRGAINAVSTVDPSLGKKMTKYLDNPLEIYFKHLKDQDPLLTSVLHGDFWFNNILFQYDNNGVPKNTKFVDFQLSRVGTITWDLSYFMYTSTTRSLRKDHYADFICKYYDNYVNTLGHLGVDVPQKFTVDYLMQRLKEAMPCAVVFMPFAMPMQLAGDPKKNITDRSGMAKDQPMSEEEMKEAAMKGQMEMATNLTKIMNLPHVKKRMVEFYEEMAEFGVL